MEINKLYEGDCLEIMLTLPDKSIDMILCDLPYGTTACKWDTIIPFEPLWKQYKQLIKDDGAIVLTASQPFTSALVMSNPGWFKYEWIWDKVLISGFQIAKYKPPVRHENILVFGNGKICYNPEMTKRDIPIKGYATGSESSPLKYTDKTYRVYTHKHPQSIIVFQRPKRVGEVHPTQKPVALFEYLIRTYTNENDTVLDNCAGSGTTGIACMNTNRNYIMIEKDPEYCKIIQQRISNHNKEQMPLNIPIKKSIQGFFSKK